MPLIICNYILVAAKYLPKTLCKNPTKTPQKSSKNPNELGKNLLP